MHDYNSNRPPLILREYGRNVQKIVAKIKETPDKATRTQQAQGALGLMATLTSSSKDSMESTQKRWDDLFIISDYLLEVDSPHPMPEKGALNKRQPRLAYVKQPIKFRNYGRNIERLIQKAEATQGLAEQTQLVISIAKLMKIFSNEWNRDNIDCDTILTHIRQMAGDQLTVDWEQLKAQNIFSTSSRERNRNGRTNRGITKRKKAS
ncbi:MAG: DUF4290 domain-containing protein [Bacteroidota bacterium]